MTGNWKCGPVLASSLLVSTLLVSIFPGFGCAQRTFIHPSPIPLQYPLYVSLDQVSNDYQLDPASADVKYKGNRIVFNNVEVDELYSYYYQSGGAIGLLMTDYFRSGLVRFELQDFRGAQQRIQVGYVLNLDGICQGLVGGLVRVTDCWVGSVKGDLGIGLPAFGQY